jgi:multidrug efflux pump subunit AcrA (membrane-fusion protein)
LGACVVLRPLPVTLALALTPTADTFDLNQIRYRSDAILEVDLSRTETVKLEAEQADSAVEALSQAKAQLAQAPKGASPLEFLDAQRTYVATEVEYIQEPSAHWNAVFQIEAATAMELIQ